MHCNPTFMSSSSLPVLYPGTWWRRSSRVWYLRTSWTHPTAEANGKWQQQPASDVTELRLRDELGALWTPTPLPPLMPRPRSCGWSEWVIKTTMILLVRTTGLPMLACRGWSASTQICLHLQRAAANAAQWPTTPSSSLSTSSSTWESERESEREREGDRKIATVHMLTDICENSLLTAYVWRTNVSASAL